MNNRIYHHHFIFTRHRLAGADVMLLPTLRQAVTLAASKTSIMKRYSCIATLLFLLFSCFVGCTKQKSYPTDTNDGQGTFGATINNKQVLPCVPFLTNGGPISTNSFQYSPTLFSISISARNTCDKNYTYGRYVVVSFDSILVVENATYKFGNGFNAANNQVRCVYSEDLSDYVSDSTLPGSITVRKFDPLSRIISASFEATSKEKNNGQLRTLTQGKFDLKY